MAAALSNVARNSSAFSAVKPSVAKTRALCLPRGCSRFKAVSGELQPIDDGGIAAGHLHWRSVCGSETARVFCANAPREAFGVRVIIGTADSEVMLSGTCSPHDLGNRIADTRYVWRDYTSG